MYNYKTIYSVIMINKNTKFFIAISLITSLLVSCTIKPEKITNTEKIAATKATLNTLHIDDGSKEFKIDLRKAIALAMDSNLEYRIKKVQSALAYKQYDLAKTELYPNIDLKSDYNNRNRDYIKTLGDVSGGTSAAQSLIPHTIKTGSVVFNWDILDFGLSYVRAKQAADRYLLAVEQRKQMAATIINDVIKNYTLAYYGQELNEQLQEIETSVNDAITITDKAIEQEVGERQLILGYRKALIEDYRQAKDNVIYFNQSRDKLLNLINYNAKVKMEDVQLKLAAPDPYLLKLPSLNSDLLHLDTIALFFRPELSESIYKIREIEKQKAVTILEKLPSLGFNLGYNYDSDKYLKFQNWWSHNLNLAWNLLHMATIPAAIDTVETQLETARLTHLASSAVILGEVRVLLYNYRMKKYDFHLAEDQSKFATNLYNHTLNLVTSGMGDEQTLVTDKLVALNSELSKLRSFVDARNLFEDLVLALGLYNYGGEFIHDDGVDFNIVNTWFENFNAKTFDEVINEEYKKIDSGNDLASASKYHKEYKEQEEKNKKDAKEKKSEEHHSKVENDDQTKLTLNLSEIMSTTRLKNTYNTIASQVGDYLAQLFGDTA
jgi:multidrug efflux system outer membrane protein